MAELDQFSVKIKNFKCFGEIEQGFDQIKLINLIIGRNNSGKSTLLDLIDYLVKGAYDFPNVLWHGNKPPEIIAESPLHKDILKNVFRPDTRGGDIPGTSHWEFGKKYIGTVFSWRLNGQKDQHFVEIDRGGKGRHDFDKIHNSTRYLENLANKMSNPYAGRQFRRIYAERNIAPEIDSSGNLEVSGDGQGVTNIIQNFINKSQLRSDLVEKTLLDELNTVFKTDANFTDIVCQQLESGAWEIYLEEKQKGRIPLSQSGSGLKSIILVLVYIHLVPVVAKKPLSDFIFGFEELENNLHPALLRRLLSYLYDKAKSEGCIFFLTTHSNVEIDLFSTNEDAQIIHVTHDGKQALVRTVKTYIDNKGILDDLDVRASDLLQSNGIIWVEGPSDRIYLNRWINLWSDGELVEGNQYQCVYYGGRLLSHLSSEEPELVEEGISILRVNKNACILIDSDKRAQQTPLNATKERIIGEIKDNGGMAWVTKGKEIENYISSDALAKFLDLESVEQVGQYNDFFEYLDDIKDGMGRQYATRKPLLSEKISPHITRENMVNVLDLSDKLEQICAVIRRWNNI